MNAARSKLNMRLASSSDQGEAEVSEGGQYVSAEGSGSHVDDSCASKLLHCCEADFGSCLAVCTLKQLPGPSCDVYMMCVRLLAAEPWLWHT